MYFIWIKIFFLFIIIIIIIIINWSPQCKQEESENTLSVRYPNPTQPTHGRNKKMI